MSNQKMPWFRLYSEAVDNEKLRLLAFEDRWHYIAILCCKRQGIIDSDDGLMRRKLAVKLGVQVRELEEIARRLSEVGLIDCETMQPRGWDERQFSSDADATAAERKRRERERKNKQLQESRVTSRVTVTNVTRQEADTEADTEKKKTTKKVDVAKDIAPTCVSAEVWKSFVEHRKDMRKPMTEHAAKLMAKKLDEFHSRGVDVVEAIETSIRSRWSDVYEPKQEKKSGRSSHLDAVLSFDELGIRVPEIW